MTSKLKCPFCGEELFVGDAFIDVQYANCRNPGCKQYGVVIPVEIWQALMQAKQDLEIVVDALKSAKKRFELINNSKFANLNNVLQIQSQCEILKINQALEQIEHKE